MEEDINEFLAYLVEYCSENNYDESILNEIDVLCRGGYVWIDYLEKGDKIKTKPKYPGRNGYEFTGWYLDRGCTKRASLSIFVKGEEDISFYAGWKKVDTAENA